MKILICGLPGSGKTTLAEALAKKLPKCVRLNADDIREKYNDWDFSPEARYNQAYRMRYLSDGVIIANSNALVDFVCPGPDYVEIFEADYIIWMNTIEESRYEDTNKLYNPPNRFNYKFDKWYDPEEMATDVYYDFLNFQIS